jgi:hypothetical protein
LRASDLVCALDGAGESIKPPFVFVLHRAVSRVIRFQSCAAVQAVNLLIRQRAAGVCPLDL